VRPAATSDSRVGSGVPDATSGDGLLDDSYSIDDIRNLADAVRRSARRTPDTPALIRPASPGGPRTVVTWRDLDERVDAVASGLCALQMSSATHHQGAPAARIAVCLSNVPEFAYALFGGLRAGFVAVLVNPTFTAREVNHQLTDSGAEVLITDGSVLARLAPDQPRPLHTYTVDHGDARPFTDLLRGSAATPEPSGGEDLAVLLYTSGTAGAPRAAMLTHRALIANHRQVEQVDPPVVAAGDRMLLALPLFHAFGLNAGLGAIAWHGATGVLMDRFDPVDSLRVIAEERVTVITAVPQMYAAWAAQPDVASAFREVRLAISGAAPLGAAAGQRFQAASGRRLFEGYGLTETAPVVATALASPTPKDGSVGRPVPGVELKLVDRSGGVVGRVTADGLIGVADDFDDDAGGVPGTDPGEIVVRGPNLFSGYWPDGVDGPDPDGWWPTGDVAYADADGDLFLVDRLGELIIVNGFNVYPHEIELVLAAHPAVLEVAVVGVPSEQTGEAVKAYVVAAPDSATSSAALVEELRAYCERNLARFKCPTAIEILPALERSATGKIRKGVLRKEER
jgi:long-chain acyl-CoA synthetase